MGQTLRLKKGSKLTFQELDNNFEFPNVWDSDSIYATGMRIFDGTLLDYLCIQDVTSPSTIPLTNTAYWKKIGDSTNAVWGDITGTLSDQLDLQAALDDKIPFTSQNYVSVNANGSGTVNGTALFNAVQAAQLLTPNGSVLGSTNRAVVLLLPGVYDLGSNNISLDQFVDIIGLGDSEEIIITSINSTGTIQIADTNDYVLRNLSIFNTGSGGSIVHHANQFDAGIWDNLILQGKNTVGTTFSGTYNKLYCLSDNILNGSIDFSAKISNSIFLNNSCGFSDGPIALNMNGTINNCTGLTQCFGVSTLHNVTINGQIINCKATDFSFGYTTQVLIFNSGALIKDCIGNTFCYCVSSSSGVVFFGKIINCIGSDNSFAYASLNISYQFGALIKNCVGGANSFASSDSGTVNISGYILDCVSNISCFGFSTSGDVTINTDSFIVNCKSTTNSFGSAPLSSVTIDGNILNCVATVNSYGYSNNNLLIGNNAIIKDCIGTQECFGYSINGNITINGLIKDCIGTFNSFGCAPSGTMDIGGSIFYSRASTQSFGFSLGNCNISGFIKNCEGSNHCFGYSGATTAISGIIEECVGGTFCFGNTTSTGQIIDCIRTGGYGVHAGSIEKCKFSENSASVPTITVTTGCRLKYNTIFQAGASDVVFASVAATPIVSCFNNMNKARNANAVNSIATPYDVIDSNVTL